MLNKTLNLIDRPGNILEHILVSFLLLSSIIFFLSIQGWTNRCFFVLLIPSLFYIKRSYAYTFQSQEKSLLLLVFLSLSLPTIAIFISQLVRQDWAFKSYDGPSRFLFSILIFLFFTFKRINFSHLIGLASPLTLFFTAGSIYLHPEVLDAWPGRFATSFVHPNTFGTYSVVFTSFCLFHIDVSFKTSKSWFFYQLMGFSVGLFLILGSGTRGSWLSIPAIGIIWLLFNYRKITRPFIYLAIFTLTISCIGSAVFFPQTIERLISGFNEITHWLDNSEVDSSTGVRLSIWKISWQLFLQQPLFGYGNQGFVSYSNDPSINLSASSLAKQTMICCGPHNELISNTLRSGLLGSLSIVSIFSIPFFLFSKNAFINNPEVARASQIGLAFIACVAISSISMEVFHLKYTSTFYGLIIAGLSSQIFSHKIEH